MALVHEDGNFPGTEAHRRRRHEITGRSDPEMDAYPEPPPPRVQVFLVAFREGESYDGEHVDTDGLSVREFIPGLGREERRRWLAARIVAAHARLVARIDAEGEPG